MRSGSGKAIASAILFVSASGAFIALRPVPIPAEQAQAVAAILPDPFVLPPLVPLEHPAEVRALYITASIVRSGKMDGIVNLIKDSSGEFAPNAVVIDIQDDRGRVLIDDRLRSAIRRLRFLRIFPIARLVAFQNDSVAEEKPGWAVHRSDGSLWRDRGGRHWLDPSNEDAWSYLAGVAREAIDAGFGEINFDYFRFPSEGVTSAVYPFWRENEGREKSGMIVDVAEYLKAALKAEHPDIGLSVDIFGYTFMRTADLGIGQSAPALAAVFDAVCPMIYPSHFDPGNFGFDNPAAHPYEVMAGTLAKGREIFAAAGQPFTNVRPWIQDFNMGADYTPEMVRAQIGAIHDAGLSAGWLNWNPSNRYRPELFK